MRSSHRSEPDGGGGAACLMRRGLLSLLVCLAAAPLEPLWAQPAPVRRAQRILVIPFENVTRESRIVWLGEAASVHAGRRPDRSRRRRDHRRGPSGSVRAPAGAGGQCADRRDLHPDRRARRRRGDRRRHAAPPGRDAHRPCPQHRARDGQHSRGRDRGRAVRGLLRHPRADCPADRAAVDRGPATRSSMRIRRSRRSKTTSRGSWRRRRRRPSAI